MGLDRRRRLVSRGDVWWVDLDPVRGSEAAKRRPAVIVGRDALVKAAMTRANGMVTVVPVTTNTTNVYPFQVLLPAGTGGLPTASKAQAEQIRTISVTRLVERIGAVPPPVSNAIDNAIRLYLGL